MKTDELKKKVSAGTVLILDTYKVWGWDSLLLPLGFGLFIYAFNLLLNSDNLGSILKISFINYLLSFVLIISGLVITVISFWRIGRIYWKLKEVYESN